MPTARSSRKRNNCSSAWRSCTRSTRCWACGGAAWGSCTRRSAGCRRGPNSRRPARGSGGGAGGGAGGVGGGVDFFWLGTNPLTQTTFGFSRDDSGKFIQHYLSFSELCPRCGEKIGKDLSCTVCKVKTTKRPANILDKAVFVTLDQEGVGFLVRMGLEKGRAVRPNLKGGCCGEHGGDPRSVEFCHRAGLDYVSCSPS